MFHGGGTNSAIFRLQCRPIMRALRNEFRFCFVEAPYQMKPAANVARAFKGMGPYKAWVLWRAPDENRAHGEALRLIENAVKYAIAEDDAKGADGEWAGVMGFSQGAKVGASILATNQFRREQGLGGGLPSWPQFRFGILLAGRGPLNWMDEDESEMPAGLITTAATSEVEHDDSLFLPMEQQIKTPTLHLHGLLDPGIALHRKMFKRFCHPGHKKLMEWEGDHMVPLKTADVDPLLEEIRSMASKAMAD